MKFSDSRMRKKSMLLGFVTLIVFPLWGNDGQTIFRKNCVACHSIGKGRLVGPDLKDVHTKRSDEWLLKWTKSSSALIKAGDPEAVAIFNEYKIPMTNFDFLSDEEIKSIFAYIKTESEPQVAEAPAVPEKIESVPIQEEEKASIGLSFGSYFLIALIVLCLIVVVQLSRTIKVLSDKLR